MKEECKLFLTGLKDKKEYYTYAIKKDGTGELFECIQFPKNYQTPLRDQLSVEFMSYWKTTSYHELPEVESPFVTIEEIREKTNGATFLGFGHSTIDPSLQENLFYLFFQGKDSFFEIVFAECWNKTLDENSIYFLYETDSIHDLSMGEVDVFKPAQIENISKFPINQVYSIAQSIGEESMLVLFQDGRYAAFSYDRFIPEDNCQMRIAFDTIHIDHISVDVLLYETGKVRPMKLHYTSEDMKEDQVLFVRKNCLSISLEDLIREQGFTPERICVVCLKDDLDLFGNIEFSLRESSMLPFIEHYYDGVKKKETEKEEDRCFLFELIQVEGGYKLRTHFKTGKFLGRYLNKAQN